MLVICDVSAPAIRSQDRYSDSPSHVATVWGLQRFKPSVRPGQLRYYCRTLTAPLNLSISRPPQLVPQIDDSAHGYARTLVAMPIRQHDIDNFFSRSSSAAATPSKPGRSSARQSEVITIDDSDEDVAPSVRPTVQTANITPSTWSQRRAPLASSSRTQRPRELSITSGEEGAPNEEEYSSGEDIRDVKLSPTQTHRWSITQRRVIDPDDDHSESAHQSSRKPTRGHSSDSESGKPLRTTRNRSSTTRVTRSSGKRKARASSSDESERTPPPETKRKGTVGSRARVKNVSRRSDSSQEDITARHTTRRREAPSSSRNGKVTRARATRPDESASEGSDSVSQAPSQPKETPAKRRLRRMRMKRLGRDISSSEDRVISSDGLEVSDSRTPIRRARRPKPKGSSKRRRATDPDEDTGGGADTEEEAPDELQLDEPERFKTTTRLRKRKETAHQRLLRKLKNKRLNLPSSESESEDSEEEEEEDHQSLPDSLDDSSSGFITEDGEEVNESLMPAEFSLGYAQSKEYKFKVMFQYLLLVVMHGPGVLPLKGKQKEYMQPVAELREYIKGIRNLRVRSQIWRAEFVRAMEMYPEFQVSSIHGTTLMAGGGSY